MFKSYVQKNTKSKQVSLKKGEVLTLKATNNVKWALASRVNADEIWILTVLDGTLYLKLLLQTKSLDMVSLQTTLMAFKLGDNN